MHLLFRIVVAPCSRLVWISMFTTSVLLLNIR